MPKNAPLMLPDRDDPLREPDMVAVYSVGVVPMMAPLPENVILAPSIVMEPPVTETELEPIDTLKE